MKPKTVLWASRSGTVLIDRGFEHRALLHWLQQQRWSWAIRVKSDLNVSVSDGRTLAVEPLLAPTGQTYLFPNVSVLDGITSHLATATVSGAKESWAVLSEQRPSLQTLAFYGQRFGGIEPHFKDYKSAAFDGLQSGLRDVQALNCLFMLLDCASLLALILESCTRRPIYLMTDSTAPEPIEYKPSAW